MKLPRKDFASSLRHQAPQVEEVEVRQQRTGGPSMVAPGEGGVKLPPGALREQGTRAARSAALFGDVMRRYGGGNAD